MINTLNRGWIFGAFVRLEMDQVAFEKDRYRIPPPIDHTISSSQVEERVQVELIPLETRLVLRNFKD